MELVIENCNNISRAVVKFVPYKLNIKYAPNGTGKSTIAKAIAFAVQNDGSLSDLLPFEMRGKAEDLGAPSVTGVDGIKTVKCFNEDYVNQFVFRRDELVANSFDVIVKSPEYQELVQQVDQLTADIKKCFDGNEELDCLISNCSVERPLSCWF